MSIAAFADGLFVVLYAPFVKTILAGTAVDIGYLTSAQAAGGLIGGLLIPRIAKKLSPAHLIALTGVILGLNHLFLFNYPAFFPGIVPALGLFCLGGIATIGFFVQLTTLLQTQTPDTYRGRIFGLYGVTWAFFLVLGTTLTGFVGDRVNILLLLDIEAALFFPAAIIAWLFLRPHATLPLPTPADQK